MSEVSLGAPVAGAAAQIFAAFAGAFHYPEDDQGPLSRAEFIEAFDSGASSIAVSLREADHIDRDASGLFEELVRFYEHFGLRRRQDAELPDHLSVQLEFMQFLCRLEHEAEMAGGDIGSSRLAQKDFLDRHLLPLLGAIASAMGGRESAATDLVLDCAEFTRLHRHRLAEDD